MRISFFRFIFAALFSFLFPLGLSALPVSCSNHGGIACSKGADKDGSVICLDDFRDSATPYRFQCSSAKLSIDSIAEESDLVFKILIKNETQVPARQVKLFFSYYRSKLINYEINGPEMIEGNGLEEYTLVFKPDNQNVKIPDALREFLKVQCENCQ